MGRLVAIAASAGLLTLGFSMLAIAQDQPIASNPARFDVVSVRPHRGTDDVMFALQFHEGGRLTATGTLRMLIRTAYRLQEFQAVGAQGWIDDERFDIDARVGRGATPDEMRVMLRALLRERFGLALRSERRNAPVYALRAARSGRGARLKPAAETCPAGSCDVRFSPGVLKARGVTMAMLAGELSWWVDRIVTDQTALTDEFDLDLEWAPDLLPQAPAAISTSDLPLVQANPNAPSIFTAVREQLGLSLEPTRGEIDVFVIERAERPAP